MDPELYKLMMKTAKEINKKYEQIALEEAKKEGIQKGIQEGKMEIKIEIAKKLRATNTRRNSRNHRIKNRRNKIIIV
nr:hypothetical protein [uncultured Methanobrevibacter sp.]